MLTSQKIIDAINEPSSAEAPAWQVEHFASV
jgi:hypothetical protein